MISSLPKSSEFPCFYLTPKKRRSATLGLGVPGVNRSGRTVCTPFGLAGPFFLGRQSARDDEIFSHPVGHVVILVNFARVDKGRLPSFKPGFSTVGFHQHLPF